MINNNIVIKFGYGCTFVTPSLSDLCIKITKESYTLGCGINVNKNSTILVETLIPIYDEVPDLIKKAKNLESMDDKVINLRNYTFDFNNYQKESVHAFISALESILRFQCSIIAS